MGLVIFHLGEETEGRSHRCDQYLKGGCQEDEVSLFSVVPSDGARGYKLEHSKFHLHTRRIFILSGRALKQTVQQGGKVSTSEVILNLPGSFCDALTRHKNGRHI